MPCCPPCWPPWSPLCPNTHSTIHTLLTQPLQALRAYGSGAMLPTLLAALDDMLLRAREQPEESHKYTGLSNTTTFGVAARKARDNDPKVGVLMYWRCVFRGGVFSGAQQTPPP